MTCSPPGPSIHGISQARNTGVGCHSASYMALVVKNPSANAGEVRDAGSIPGSGRSPGGGRGNSLQDSYHWDGRVVKALDLRSNGHVSVWVRTLLLVVVT